MDFVATSVAGYRTLHAQISTLLKLITKKRATLLQEAALPHSKMGVRKQSVKIKSSFQSFELEFAQPFIFITFILPSVSNPLCFAVVDFRDCWTGRAESSDCEGGNSLTLCKCANADFCNCHSNPEHSSEACPDPPNSGKHLVPCKGMAGMAVALLLFLSALFLVAT